MTHTFIPAALCEDCVGWDKGRSTNAAKRACKILKIPLQNTSGCFCVFWCIFTILSLTHCAVQRHGCVSLKGIKASFLYPQRTLMETVHGCRFEAWMDELRSALAFSSVIVKVEHDTRRGWIGEVWPSLALSPSPDSSLHLSFIPHPFLQYCTLYLWIFSFICFYSVVY